MKMLHSTVWEIKILNILNSDTFCFLTGCPFSYTMLLIAVSFNCYSQFNYKFNCFRNMKSAKDEFKSDRKSNGNTKITPLEKHRLNRQSLKKSKNKKTISKKKGNKLH